MYQQCRRGRRRLFAHEPVLLVPGVCFAETVAASTAITATQGYTSLDEQGEDPSMGLPAPEDVQPSALE